MCIFFRISVVFFTLLFSSLSYGQIQQALEDSEKLGILNFCRPLSDAFTKEEKKVGSGYFKTVIDLCNTQGNVNAHKCINGDEGIEEIVAKLKSLSRSTYTLEHGLTEMKALLLFVSIKANCEKAVPRPSSSDPYHLRK